MVFQMIVDLMKENSVDLKWEDVQTIIQQFYVVVGMKLGQEWELPGTVIESIAFHQDYQSATKSPQEAMICCAANQMATLLLADEPINIEPLMELEVMEQLNLYEEDLQKLIDMSGDIKQLVEAMSV